MDTLQTPLETTAVAPATSAVSWGAIFAGAAVAGATSLLLFALGAGLGLAALSPGRSAAFSAGAVAIGLIATQWIASFLGGYITGRLRTRWVGTHTHEVFFRDTAHGFITWCVATVFMASGLVAAASSLPAIRIPLNRPTAYQSVQATGSAVPNARLAEASPAGGALVLPEHSGADAPDAARWEPVAGIPAPQTLASSGPPHMQLLAANTPDGDAADTDRRDDAASSIVTALSMLIGAFIASVAAALGGRLRDLHP
jgi:hypothetical protein